jgi:hypothetical protein
MAPYTTASSYGRTGRLRIRVTVGIIKPGKRQKKPVLIIGLSASNLAEILKGRPLYLNDHHYGGLPREELRGYPHVAMALVDGKPASVEQRSMQGGRNLILFYVTQSQLNKLESGERLTFDTKTCSVPISADIVFHYGDTMGELQADMADLIDKNTVVVKMDSSRV